MWNQRYPPYEIEGNTAGRRLEAGARTSEEMNALAGLDAPTILEAAIRRDDLQRVTAKANAVMQDFDQVNERIRHAENLVEFTANNLQKATAVNTDTFEKMAKKIQRHIKKVKKIQAEHVQDKTAGNVFEEEQAHRQELETLSERHRQQVEALSTEHDQQIDQVRQDMEALSTKYRRDADTHRDEMNDKVENHRLAMEDQAKAYRQAMEDQAKEYRQAMEDQAKEYRQAMEDQAKKYRQDHREAMDNQAEAHLQILHGLEDAVGDIVQTGLSDVFEQAKQNAAKLKAVSKLAMSDQLGHPTSYDSSETMPTLDIELSVPDEASRVLDDVMEGAVGDLLQSSLKEVVEQGRQKTKTLDAVSKLAISDQLRLNPSLDGLTDVVASFDVPELHQPAQASRVLDDVMEGAVGDLLQSSLKDANNEAYKNLEILDGIHYMAMSDQLSVRFPLESTDVVASFDVPEPRESVHSSLAIPNDMDDTVGEMLQSSLEDVIKKAHRQTKTLAHVQNMAQSGQLGLPGPSNDPAATFEVDSPRPSLQTSVALPEVDFFDPGEALRESLAKHSAAYSTIMVSLAKQHQSSLDRGTDLGQAISRCEETLNGATLGLHEFDTTIRRTLQYDMGEENVAEKALKKLTKQYRKDLLEAGDTLDKAVACARRLKQVIRDHAL